MPSQFLTEKSILTFQVLHLTSELLIHSGIHTHIHFLRMRVSFVASKVVVNVHRSSLSRNAHASLECEVNDDGIHVLFTTCHLGSSASQWRIDHHALGSQIVLPPACWSHLKRSPPKKEGRLLDHRGTHHKLLHAECSDRNHR
mmetsp:Transcript_12258/g.31322  ORF Transcript_12258/g.31322 Transcript_12258/m.31322 type:complete len:143 (+) Transcript_12258:92-520(+)